MVDAATAALTSLEQLRASGCRRIPPPDDPAQPFPTPEDAIIAQAEAAVAAANSQSVLQPPLRPRTARAAPTVMLSTPAPMAFGRMAPPTRIQAMPTPVPGLADEALSAVLGVVDTPAIRQVRCSSPLLAAHALASSRLA